MALGIAPASLAAGCGASEIGGPGGDPGGGGGPDGGGDDDDGDGGPSTPPDPGDASQVITVCADGNADFATLGEAIEAAWAGETIEACAGTYAERLVIDHKPLVLRGIDGAAATILDAGGGGTALLVRDVEGAFGAAQLVIEGFTIRGGATTGQGGGVRCEASKLSMADSALTANQAGDGGGGLAATDCELALTGLDVASNDGGVRGGGLLAVDSRGTIAASRFTGNQAASGGGVAVVGGAIAVAIRGNELRGNIASGEGGALYLEADAQVEENLVIDNSSGWTGGGIHIQMHAPTLRANQVRHNRSENDGGGIYAHQTQAVLVDNLVSDNSAGDDGGGIRIFTSNARLENNQLLRNHAAGDGGGLKISHLPCQLDGNAIVDNVAVGYGGGIEMDNDASQVRGGLIAGNHSSRGGGIHAALAPWNDGTIQDVRILDNLADRGGGIALENNFQTYTLRGLTVRGNTANHGGGIYVRTSDVTLTHSTIAANVATAEGGGVEVDDRPEPWTEPCPCPPTAASGTIAFVVVHGNEAPDGAGMWLDAPALAVSSSIVSGHAGVGVAVVGSLDGWRYNDTEPASFSGMDDPTGHGGNLSADPAFLDAAIGDFRLGSGSPCIDAGDPAYQDLDDSRADIGRFGGMATP